MAEARLEPEFDAALRRAYPSKRLHAPAAHLAAPELAAEARAIAAALRSAAQLTVTIEPADRAVPAHTLVCGLPVGPSFENWRHLADAERFDQLRRGPVVFWFIRASLIYPLWTSHSRTWCNESTAPPRIAVRTAGEPAGEAWRDAIEGVRRALDGQGYREAPPELLALELPWLLFEDFSALLAEPDPNADVPLRPAALRHALFGAD